MSAKLYLNPRWRLDDIVKVLERTQGAKVEVMSCHEIVPRGVGFYYFNVANRQIAVFVNSSFPTGAVTALHLDGDNVKILKDIANVFGGIFTEDEERYELMEGAMNEDNGLPYFVKYAVVHDGIKPDDTQAFIDSKRKWHERVEHKEMSAIH